MLVMDVGGIFGGGGLRLDLYTVGGLEKPQLSFLHASVYEGCRRGARALYAFLVLDR